MLYFQYLFHMCRGLKCINGRDVCCFMISCKNSINIDTVIDWLVKHSKWMNWSLSSALLIYLYVVLQMNLADWTSVGVILVFLFPFLTSLHQTRQHVIWYVHSNELHVRVVNYKVRQLLMLHMQWIWINNCFHNIIQRLIFLSGRHHGQQSTTSFLIQLEIT